MVNHEKQSEGVFELKADADQTYRMCWTPMDSAKKVISFDFHLPDEKMSHKAATAGKDSWVGLMW